MPHSRNTGLSTTVHAYLRQNYPERVLGWVRRVQWKRVGNVPLSKIAMDRRPGGRDMTKVKGIGKAIQDGEKMDPIVLVDTGSGKLKVADGYHRTLAYRHAGKSHVPRAYIAVVKEEHGPWDRAMHDAKLNKSLAETDLGPESPVYKALYTEEELRKRGRKELEGKSIMDLFRDEFQDYMSSHALENSRIVNAVADKVHEQWMDFAKKVEGEIDPDHAAAWQTMYVPYDELPDEEQEKDRIFARRILGSILDALKESSEVKKSHGSGPPDALTRAYEKAYRNFTKDDMEHPTWSKMVSGSRGEAWKASDGWGDWFFLLTPAGKAVKLGTRMADVMAYHFDGPLKELTKADGITRNNFGERVGFGDKKWTALLKRVVDGPPVKKSVQRPSPQIEGWATEDPSPHDLVFNWAQEQFGHHFTGAIKVQFLEPVEDGDKVRISDDGISFVALLPHNGPPRLLKALATSVPTPNSVWSILHEAGFPVHVEDGQALVDGTSVSVRNHRVVVEGKRAKEIFECLLTGLQQLQPSEDYTSARIGLGNPNLTVQPW